MKFYIGNAEEYRQAFVTHSLTDEDIPLLTQAANKVTETLSFTPTFWALTGGAALTYLLNSLDTLPEGNYTQDLDILLENGDFLRIVTILEEQKRQTQLDSIKKEDTFRSFQAVPSMEYSALPKLPLSHDLKHIVFNELQVVNNNPAAAILEVPLVAMTRDVYRRNNTSLHSLRVSYAKERLATYKMNKDVRVSNPSEFMANWGGNDKLSTLIQNTVRYISSFDITHCQVAVIFSGTMPLTFIVAEPTALAIATKTLSLTKEQEDMFTVAGFNKILNKHLEIVVKRIHKYADRYSLEIPNHIQGLISHVSNKLRASETPDIAVPTLSSELPF